MSEKMLIAEGSFDPITNSTIASLKGERKVRGVSSLAFLIRNDIFDKRHHPSVKEKEERIRLAFKDDPSFGIFFVNEDESLHPVNHPEFPYVRIDDKKENQDVRNGICFNCPLEVSEYIRNKGYYFLPELRRLRKTARYLHSQEVAKRAYILAKNSGEDENLAFIAGLYHDCAKDLPYPDQVELVKNGLHPEFASLPAFAIHQAASPELRRNKFHVEDRAVYDARLYHCTGKADRTERQKIIFSADKVEPTRKFPTQERREALRKDLDSGFIHLLRSTTEYFRRNQVSYKDTPFAKDRYKYYLGDQNA